jgi:hypothetical protein
MFIRYSLLAWSRHAKSCIGSTSTRLQRQAIAQRLRTEKPMSPTRFIECLILLRWTPINLASALQCDLSWIEGMEVGNETIPLELEEWLEALAAVHAVHPPLQKFRGRRSGFWPGDIKKASA